jgi:hypothetical protein
MSTDTAPVAGSHFDKRSADLAEQGAGVHRGTTSFGPPIGGVA